MHRLIWLGTIALLLLPLAASSQEPLTIGSRIRITVLGEGSSELHSGTVVRAGADTVVLRLDSGGETETFSLARLSRLEVSQGLRGHVAAGLGLGFLAGGATGALFAALACAGEDACASGSSDDLGRFYALVGATVIGGVVGTVVGGVVGARHKTERWEAVPSSRWHLSAFPAGPGSFDLALSVRF